MIPTEDRKQTGAAIASFMVLAGIAFVVILIACELCGCPVGEVRG